MRPLRKLALVTACFFFSGAAGLVYQTAWAQQLTLVFGASEQAVAAVLASYMGGLAIGAGLAGRFIRRLRRPLATYGLFELAIGVSALLVPWAISLAGQLHGAWLGSPSLAQAPATAFSSLFYLLTSFIVLLPPTALMGATLPLLARYAVRRRRDIGPYIAVLYAANTAGAAGGALGSAFLLLPRLGLGQTVWVAAAINGLVFALVIVLVRLEPRAGAAGTSMAGTSMAGTGAADTGAADTGAAGEQTTETPRPGAAAGPTAAPAAEPGPATGRAWILPAMLASGFVSFSLEVLWTRLLTSLLGSSLYAFAVMLASFLVALALGAALATALTASAASARRGFALAQIAVAGLTVACFAGSEHLPSLLPSGLPPALLAALVMTPGAVAIGVTFPCAVRMLTRSVAETAGASGRIFAWNTAGAILGALVTGFHTLPRLGFAGVVLLVAAISLSLAALAAWVQAPRQRGAGWLAAAMLAALLVWPPATPWTLLRHSPLSGQGTPGEITYFAVGRSATVLMADHRHAFRLLTNGLPESSIETASHREGRHLVARWLSLLPVAARPESRSLLVVGLGAGITVEDVPAPVESIDVLEIEPEVVHANRLVSQLRRKDPLADPRVRVHVGDARGSLQRTSQRWHAIVSQPSHPWTSGASHLYSREFFALAQDRLEPDGVFVQWMAFAFVDGALFRSLAATLADVFAHVEIYRPHPGSVLLLASGSPLRLAETAGRALELAPREWAQAGVLCPEDIVAAQAVDGAGVARLAAGAPLITDDRNLLRMRSPRIRHDALGPAGGDRLLADLDPLAAEVPATLDAAYLVRRLLRQGSIGGAGRLASALADPASRRPAEALVALATGRRQRAQRLLGAGSLGTLTPEAEAALLHLYSPAAATGQPLPFVTGGSQELRTVAEGWHLAAAGDWRSLRAMEARLAPLEPRHPLHDDAVRLRAAWRAQLGSAPEAAAGLELLSPLLSPLPSRADLLLRARLGARAGEPGIALTALDEARTATRGRPSRQLVGQACALLEDLEVSPADESWRRELLAWWRKRHAAAAR